MKFYALIKIVTQIEECLSETAAALKWFRDPETSIGLRELNKETERSSRVLPDP